MVGMVGGGPGAGGAPGWAAADGPVLRMSGGVSGVAEFFSAEAAEAKVTPKKLRWDKNSAGGTPQTLRRGCGRPAEFEVGS